MTLDAMPLAARVVDHALALCPPEMRAAALAGRGNDRRIRAELRRLHAAGALAILPTRQDMTTGAAYLARHVCSELPPAA